MTRLLFSEFLVLDGLLIFATLSNKMKVSRALVIVEIFFATMQYSIAIKVMNSSDAYSKPAIIEVRQEIAGDAGKDIVAILLKGRFSNFAVNNEANGELVMIPEENCDETYKDFAKQFKSGWIGIVTIGSSDHSSASSQGSDNETDQKAVLERLKRAMLFGASAIIILVLNPNILQELDISQILTKPIVFVEDSENVTVLLNALKSKMKLKLRVIYGSSSIYDTQTFTVWSACWRARPGSDVVCKLDGGRQNKTDPNIFWSYFYSVIVVAILLLMLKNNQQNVHDEELEDGQTIDTITMVALSLLKTRRYKTKSHCSSDASYREDHDSCAICLDNFHRKQILRVLPCLHEFHSKCVDQWLLGHQTCPLCKSNIIEFQINEGLINRQLSSGTS